MSFIDFPELAHIDRETAQAALLLEQAAGHASDDNTAETYAEHAQRLKGAAVIATTAAMELMKASGYYEAAAAAGAHRLLDRDESGGKS